MSEIKGEGSVQFDPVRHILADHLAQGIDVGASVAITLGGETVLDIHGGFQDRREEKPWTEDTLVCVFSSGKAVMAMMVAGAVEAGLLDYEAPVATYWPEFAASGKQDITLGQVMSHQAGLSAFMEDDIASELWTDWAAVCAKIVAMTPLWTPGTANGYHPQIYGFLSGEILRRVTGKMPGQLIREFFQKPHGIDVYCGLTEAEMSRVAPMIKASAAPTLGEMTPLKKAAFLNKGSGPNGISSIDRMAAQIPGSNMHATARGLAELIVPFANKGRRGDKTLLSEKTLEAVFKERAHRDDLVLPFNISWAAGVMRNSNGAYGPNEQSIGHSGFGGSCVLADPDRGLTFSYVMNKMSPHLIGDPRSINLIRAVYDCLS